MIQFYKNINNMLTSIDKIEEGCWVNVTAPTESEIMQLVSEYGLDQGFVHSSLDEEESARIENEDDQVLLIFDYPVADKTEKATQYLTMPMGIILTDTNVFTICLRENVVLDEIAKGVVRNVQTHMKTRFVFTVLFRIASRYLQYLKQIDKMSNYVEKQLHKSLKNKELIQLLGLGKSLVYFSTSLKSNESALEKLLRGRIIKLYEEDQDLLEDVLIEIKQAIEMSHIYSSILSGTMDAFASVISNNLNIVMKTLTIITILMAIPTIVYSFYGMNVEGLPFTGNPMFALLLSVVVTVVAGLVLSRNNINK